MGHVKYQVTAQSLNVIKILYNGRAIKIIHAGKVVRTNLGGQQECLFSLILFNLYLDEPVILWKRQSRIGERYLFKH